jgi:hypothetical protein
MPVVELTDSARITALERQRQEDAARIAALDRQNKGFQEKLAVLQDELSRLRAPAPPPSAAPRKLATGQLGSVILSSLPPVLSEFRESQFLLRWRGTRDGFKVADFHRLCDGKENTLTLIQDTDDFIWGGFTPVVWHSGSKWERDPSLRSFLFTMDNSSGRGARRLHSQSQRRAIYCSASYGLLFGPGHDLRVADNCNENAKSVSNLGHDYLPDDRRPFFPAEVHFQVKEIEVS